MRSMLTEKQQQQQKEFNHFMSREIEPRAGEFDCGGAIPAEVISRLAAQGYCGAVVPAEFGGRAMDPVTFGLLCEETGRASASLLSILTVHTMLCAALLKWGTAEQKTRWLPRLASGETMGAFALTEPGTGSDAKSVETEAVPEEGSYVLSGHKKWISYGQRANLFLILAQCAGKPSAFLVERDRPGLSTVPMSGLLGFRSAMPAEIHLETCSVPEDSILGRRGSGFSYVAGTALDHGRYCVAWGCAGLARACLEASLSYSSSRSQFGALLREHQLIAEMIADMMTSVRAAQLMCLHAGRLRESADPSSIMETSMAKYFCSLAASSAATRAVQIHGANGCSGDYPAERYFRDARIMEIIEGSSQMQQLIISRHGYMGIRHHREGTGDAR